MLKQLKISIVRFQSSEKFLSLDSKAVKNIELKFEAMENGSLGP